tara:strand:- start:201 stop:563 length:363 start_codon:yes stop_codon:yes gene_type:complete
MSGLRKYNRGTFTLSKKEKEDEERRNRLGLAPFFIDRPKARGENPNTKTSPAAFKAASGDKVERRLPEGDERKDKSYKALEDLKDMKKRSKDRQNAQMTKKPEKKPPSRNERNRRRRQGR